MTYHHADAKRIAASMRISHPDDSRLEYSLNCLRNRLLRWERLGWSLGPLTVERDDDPATGEVRLAIWTTAYLDGRPTEVEEQVNRDIGIASRGTAWARSLFDLTYPAHGLPTGPRTDGDWAVRP